MIISHIADDNMNDRGVHVEVCEQIKQMQFDEYVDFSNNETVRKYNKKINYNCGMTDHYKNSRILREKELTEILGPGRRVDAFVVEDADGNKQIQEILSNGVMIAYSYKSHKKVTVFAMHPDRMFSLYISAGEFPPYCLLKISEYNVIKGYNKIMKD